MPKPSLLGVISSITFLENTVNATPQLIDSDVTFTDTEGNFNGGLVTITGLLTEDVLGIRHQGTAAGQIGVSGSNVTYGGLTIGSFSRVGGAFTVTLNAAATTTAVDALVQNLTYGNTSDTPTASRTLTLNVVDALGGDVQGVGSWTKLTGASNPFNFAGDPLGEAPNGFDAGTNAAPAFIDLDKDGDLDVIVGTGDEPGPTLGGRLVAYINNGNGTYTPQINFFNGGVAPASHTFVQSTYITNPIPVDWDFDGDLDLIVGDVYGSINYFEHGAGSTFTEQDLFAGIYTNYSDYYGYNRAAFVMDIDGDTNLDVMITGAPYAGSRVLTYRNDGAGAFTELTGGANPFNAITGVGQQTDITLIDYDGDGDQDLAIQTTIDTDPSPAAVFVSALRYVQNNGNGTFTELSGSSNPFNGLTFGDGAGGVAFFDYDGDRDQDILVGRGDGTFEYYRNNATHGVSLTVNVTAEADNTSPVIDLNGAGAGTGNTIGYTENGAALAIAPAGTVVDAESPNFDTGTLTVSYGSGGSADDRLTVVHVGNGAGQIGVAGGAVSFGGTQFGTFTGGNGTTPLVFTFDADATPAAVQALLRQIGFSNVSDTPSTSARVINFVVSDGDGGTSATASATVNVTAVNDAPVNTVSGAQTINEDASLAFTGGTAISIADADAGASTVTVTLSVAKGQLTLGGVAGLTFGAGDGTDDATMTFSGTVAAINTALNGLLYEPNGNFNGSDTLTVTTNDNGNTGADPGLSGSSTDERDSDSITINLTAINDAPVVAGDGTESAATIDEDTPGAGETVNALFAGQYSDSADNQLPNGGASSPGAFSGVAVTANGSSGATGQWQYWNGASWSDIGAVSDAAAKLFGNSTLLRFNPALDFNGTAPTLTVHLVDNSLGFGIVDGMVVDATTTGGTTAYSSGTVVLSQGVTAVDDAAVAVADSGGAVAENATVTIEVRGNDSDLDGPALAVGQIDGVAAAVGAAVTLASGATVTLEADGRLTYDPNGKFNYLISSATAGDSAAVNTSASDSFSYTLVGGGTASVTMTVTGATSAGDQLWGDAGNNGLTGGGAAELFNLGQGGDDTADGGGGNDGFYFGAELDGGDSVDGGAGADDQVGLQGNYGGLPGAPFVLGANHLVNVETLVLLPGDDTRFGDTSGALYSYNIATIDANVGNGQRLIVNFNTLRVGENVIFDGSDEHDGMFLTYGGLGNDTLTGGDKSDWFYFGNNARWGAGDSVIGGAGLDDQLGLQGSYTVTFGAGQLTGIETLVLLTGGDGRFGNPPGTGYSYDVTMDDGNVGALATMVVNANTLRAGVGGVTDETLVFDGSAESDGRFTIYSGAGNDVLVGSAGDDRIYGAGGADTLTGGAGNDTFAYLSAAHSTAAAMDQVLDFSLGDRIDLTGLDAVSGGGHNGFAFVGAAAFSNTAGELRVIDLGGGSWQIEGDVTGDGVADLVIGLTSNHALAVADFTL